MEFLIGNYSKGIKKLTINDKVKLESIFFDIDNPSYLTKHDGKVFSVSEMEDGRVANTNNPSMTTTDGMHPCFLTVVNDQLITTNYTSGNISIHDIVDNSLVLFKTVDFLGGSVYKEKQYAAHPHQVVAFKKGYFVVDLGSDCIHILNKDHEVTGQFDFPLGYGPRHSVIVGNNIHTLCELNGKIVTMDFKGKIINEVNTIEEKTHEAAAATIIYKSNTNQILASVRSSNSVYVYDFTSSGLVLNRVFDTMGVSPRDITLTIDNKYLVCCNEESDNITIFDTENDYEIAYDISTTAPTCAILV